MPRLHFERLLSKVSSGFVTAPVDRVDAQIEGCLRQLVEFLAVDHGRVMLMSPDGHALHTTYSHGADSIAAFPVIATATEFPWLVEQVRRGCVMRLGRLPDDLPPEADAERRFVTGTGIRSDVMIPFTVAGSTAGALGFGARRPRSWPDVLVKRLRAAADVIASALARRREHGELTRHLAFERLINDLVKSFVSNSVNQLDGRIQDGLDRVVDLFGVDRSGLGRFGKDGSLEVSHSARRAGVPAGPSRIDFPWYVGELSRGRTVQLNEASSGLPIVAEAERAYVQESGMRSLLAVPLEAGGRVWGAIAFAAFHEPRRWTEEEAERLRLLGEVMMNALLHRDAADEARRQQEEVAHVARVGALGELTAALAHDLNQPLAAIRANAQAVRRLLAAGRRPDDLDQIFGDIVEDATHAADLIHRVRELLRKREGGKVPLDVNQVIEGLQSLAQTEARRHGARLVLRLTPELPKVLGNAVQLQQVLLSLVRNAAEAMIETEPQDREVVVWTSAATAGEVTVSVEDHGRPHGEGILEQLFTPFYTTKAGGVGTGLAISRSIIEGHGGRLWAERRLEGGLVIHFGLPTQGR